MVAVALLVASQLSLGGESEYATTELPDSVAATLYGAQAYGCGYGAPGDGYIFCTDQYFRCDGYMPRPVDPTHYLIKYQAAPCGNNMGCLMPTNPSNCY